MDKYILFAGGGTGGHIYPALSLADEFKSRGYRCKFVGTRNKIEAELVPKRNYDIYFIWISGFHRSLRISNLLFPLKIIVSLFQSWKILKKVNPALVIGTGGYVSGPLLFVATKMKISSLIQEQNSYPGITTRLLEKRVDEIHISYDYSRQFLKTNKAYLSGNPIQLFIAQKSKEDALKDFKLGNRFTIAVMGGSLGAKSINQAIQKISEKTDLFNDVNLIWQIGKTTYNEFSNVLLRHACIKAFFDDMRSFYSAADIIISRAGALSLSEIAMAGKAAIIIPYKYAAANHQFYNAKAFEQEKAAFLIEDNDFLIKNLAEAIKQLKFDEKLRVQMKKNMKKIARPRAVHDIVESGIKLIK